MISCGGYKKDQVAQFANLFWTKGFRAHQETTARMLSSKLLILLIGSIAISSCLAAEEDVGLKEMSRKVQDIADDDDDTFATEEDNFAKIDELLGRELVRNVAKGQFFRKTKKVVKHVGEVVKGGCKLVKDACTYCEDAHTLCSLA